MNTIISVLIGLLMGSGSAWGAQEVVVANLTGTVRVRRGVEETWMDAKQGMPLYRVDTIETGKSSEVILKTEGAERFVLPEEAMLEISALEPMTKERLFLFLMSQKVARMDAGKEPIRLRNGSVPRGAMPANGPKSPKETDPKKRDLKRFHGAKALFDNGYVTNAAAAFRNLLDAAGSERASWQDRAQWAMAESFRTLEWFGKAREAYVELMAAYPESALCEAARKRIAELEKKLDH